MSLARAVLFSRRMSQEKDPNQGEGDRISARRYDKHASEFASEGNVPDAAKEAKAYVERDPDGAEKAEERAKRGPNRPFGTRVSVDELMAKGHSVIERIRPVVDRVVGNIRSRLGRK